MRPYRKVNIPSPDIDHFSNVLSSHQWPMHRWKHCSPLTFLLPLYQRAFRSWASLVAQWVKNLPAMQETLVQPLGLEVPLGRKWLPTPVFLPGEFHVQRSLEGPCGHEESDTTDWLTLSLSTLCRTLRALEVSTFAEPFMDIQRWKKPEWALNPNSYHT